eukprot:TRINITY_DN4415_c0_g1_i2.p1 TRINITY_DN4415_c0_g1~~TRINITY_DN4415_c0_g1_i2.p1  ORF type:complete len:181 (+),score=13.98 TRINITY_DN4415_c0_g1_i2:80-622(+)
MDDALHNLSLYPFVLFPQSNAAYEVDAILQLSDGTLVTCENMAIKRWTVNGQLLNTFMGHTDFVTSLMEVDEDTFLSGSYDKTLKLWNKTTGKCLNSWQCFYEPRGYCCKLLRLRNNRSVFFVGMMDGWIEERHIDNGKTIGHLHLHSDVISCFCELSNGQIVSGSWDGRLKVWNTKTIH